MTTDNMQELTADDLSGLAGGDVDLRGAICNMFNAIQNALAEIQDSQKH